MLAKNRLGNPRLVCAISLTLVFLCGALAGALAMNFGTQKTLRRDAFWTQKGKLLYLDRIKKDLSLTPVQTEQMESILDDFSAYYRTVLADGKSRIMQILNDEQRMKFEQILQERQRP